LLFLQDFSPSCLITCFITAIMMRQHFQNLAADAGVSEILLVGDKATLPSFNRRTSLRISFASSCVDTQPTSPMSKFKTLKDDFAPSFPIRKLSSGSLSSKSSSNSFVEPPLFNSRWVSDCPPLTRSKSVSPVSKTRSHRRKISEEVSIEIKSVIVGDNTTNMINNNANEEQQEENLRVSPVAPIRKASIEDCFHVAAIGLRRSHSAELVA